MTWKQNPGKGTKQGSARARSAQPIADKVLKKLRAYSRDNVIDMRAWKMARDEFERVQSTMVSRGELAKLHPAHALYVLAQNHLSALVEQLTLLPELARIAVFMESADTEYMPEGPPMSPLTRSYFTSWMFFDVNVGQGRETLGSVASAVARAHGGHETMLRLFDLMLASRTSVYVHEGHRGDQLLLRELVTDRRVGAICPSGYTGAAGDLVYARVLPPPTDDFDLHVVFTTPYQLIAPNEAAWLAYFDRHLPAGPPAARIAAFEKHMKWGPSRKHWTEFVFEGYVNHRTEVIYLKGLPDIEESRPHSRVNS